MAQPENLTIDIVVNGNLIGRGEMNRLAAAETVTTRDGQVRLTLNLQELIADALVQAAIQIRDSKVSV